MADETLPAVPKTILLIVEEKDVEGTETLASELGMLNAKTWVIKQARLLQSKKLIDIIASRGGRGNKTVYKKNRNSAGSARKRKHRP